MGNQSHSRYSINMKVICIVLLLVGSSLAAPKNLKKSEEPPYTVVQAFDGFEERSYEGKNWACTRTENENGMFQTMFKYISGANEGNVHIEMTIPVRPNGKEKYVKCVSIWKKHIKLTHPSQQILQFTLYPGQP